jgi:hypothetical protein
MRELFSSARLGVKAHDSYGLSEMNGPGVAFECKKQDELHFWSDHFIVKVLKPGVLSAQRVSEASWFSVAHQRGASADLVPDGRCALYKRQQLCVHENKHPHSKNPQLSR